MTTLATVATIGVVVAGRMFQNQPPVRAVPIPIRAAVPAIPEAVQELPVIPAVQGNVSFANA